MKVHSYRTPAPSSTSQDLERVLKNKREVTSPVFPHSALTAHLYMGFIWVSLYLSFLPLLEISFFCIFSHTFLFYSFIKSSDGAVIMYPINPQTVMSVTCQPSLVPAVPHGSVAPATCPSNQSGPGVASGQRIIQKPTQLKLCFLFHSLTIVVHN